MELPPGPLKLRRAWPRSGARLGLEYTTSEGRTVAGQWFNDAGRLERVARTTARRSPAPSAVVAGSNGARVLLQVRGADRRLAGLAALVAQPGAELLVHRPERRAVVRLGGPATPLVHQPVSAGGVRYAKVVRPERVRELVALTQAVRRAGRGAFEIPRVLEVDVELGVIVSSALDGASLYQLLNTAELVPAARAAGAALRALHTADPPLNISPHSAADEIAMLQRWFERLSAFRAELAAVVCAKAAPVFEVLAAGGSPPVLLHRDFYDKQVFFGAGGRVGLLDFDTLAVGEAALDVANALVHLELRVVQGRCSPERAIAAAAALLEGYRAGPEVWRRLDAYANATRLRLACVYAFRPWAESVAFALLDHVTLTP